MRKGTATCRCAFTLVELLVAISITVVIVVLLARVFTSAATQWQAADQRIDSFRDARAALQTIARDLSRADLTGGADMLTLRDYDVSGTVGFAKEAFAITPAPNSGKSDLCTVGYYLVWDGTNKAYHLKRLFRESDETETSLANATPKYAALFTKPTTAPEQARIEEDIATYVWDLRFSPGTLSDIEAPTANPSIKWQWVEVRFKAMSAAAARKLAGMSVSQTIWDDPTTADYRRLILPSEQQFVTRIKLEQAP